MIDSVQSYAKVNITDKKGRRIVATKKDDKYYIRNYKGVKEITADEFHRLVNREVMLFERSPEVDKFMKTPRAKRDKEIVRTVLYANPMINPFGYMPSPKGGVEPVFKNPLIESLCSALYGKEDYDEFMTV